MSLECGAGKTGNLLTMKALHDHNKSLDEGFQATGAWVTRLVQEENRHDFHNQLGIAQDVVPRDFGAPDIDDHGQYASALSVLKCDLSGDGQGPGEYFPLPADQLKDQQTMPRSIDDALKLFREQPVTDGEISPLERTLTPGINDPTVYARLRMKDINIQHGDSQSVGERSYIAKGHLRKINETKEKKNASSFSSMNTFTSHHTDRKRNN